MFFLLIVSFVWAFSFSLIKGRLAGLDSSFISAVRLGLALVVFLPFFRPRGLTRRLALAYAAIGAVQFGLMYLAYNASFAYLPAHEVALFTITTPIFVTLLADAFEHTLRTRALLAALIAVAGAAVVALHPIASFHAAGGIAAPIVSSVHGFLLVQLSNVTFALGQILYRRARIVSPGLRDRDVFALLYAGAFAVTLPLAIAQTNFAALTLSNSQIYTLLYLGVLASGVSFFLWNLGAVRVQAGTLAVFNNAKVPLAIACALLFFGEHADLADLSLGGVLLVAAVLLAETRKS